MNRLPRHTSNGRRIPKAFAEFKDYHAGETIIVCGCGCSLAQLARPEETITIGVNDVGRQFDPDYLVVLNPRNQFKADRFRFVENSRANALFTQLSLGIRHPNIVRFRLGKRGGTDCADRSGLPFTRNSPYVALCLAIYMGAKRIGLIGVDFTEHHFFSKTGVHPLSKTLKAINQEYKNIAMAAEANGIDIVNLSEHSRITAFPKQSQQQFLGHQKAIADVPARPERLNIVSYATTPVAGVPEILARCINEKTPHRCRCIWKTNDYGNGVKFNAAIEWQRQPEQALQALKQADVVIVHNGKVDARHRNILMSRPVITMAHNYLWNVEQEFTKRGYPGVVVGQYQATLPEYRDWRVVPNPLPLWDEVYRRGGKNAEITICYTPSGKHDVYPRSHRLYWHSKGYATTMALLAKLAGRYPVKLEVIRAQQRSHRQVLAMKRRAHIVIDECVTGSYHRNSLEGLASGCVVVNGIGILPEVVDVFAQCVGDAPVPFIGCTLDRLQHVLVGLIESGRDALVEAGERNRLWMQQQWDFARQWEKFWWPVIEQARETGGRHSPANNKGRANPIKTGTREKRVSARRAALDRKPDASRSATIVRKRPAAAQPAAMASAIPVYWTCRNGRRGNFGDMLSPVIVRALSGRPAVFRKSAPRLFVVGSLLKFAQKGDHVWGTGFIDEGDSAKHGVIVHAVRGPLTRERLLAQGVDCPAVYGDPALLLPAVYPPVSRARRGIGIIPHYVDSERVRQAVKRPDIRVIDVRAGVEKVLQQARRCEILLCSSLHGCILADAYGIPHAWVELGDNVVGKGFKFRDYYAATGREPACVNWRKVIDIDAAVKQALDAPPANIDLEPLVKSFPYPGQNAKVLERLSSANETSRAVSTRVQADVGTATETQSEAECPPIELAGRQTADRQTVPAAVTALEPAQNKLAVFGAVTENYAEYMIATLRSFQKHNGDEGFDYFVLGHAFSARTQRLIGKYGLRYLNLNLKSDFVSTHKHRYPRECFWIFKGPELFYQRGYRYALSVDGDILCKRRLALEWLPDLKHLAGVDRGCSVGEFLKNIGQLNAIKRKFGSVSLQTDRRATNSGVLFYNNAELSRMHFYTRMVKAYQFSERAGITRGGDDSTLALLLALHEDLELRILDNGWNVYRGLCRQPDGNPAIENALHKLRSNACIVHLNSMKPWQYHSRYPNRLVQQCVEEWRNMWPATRNQRRIKALDRVHTYRANTLSRLRPGRHKRPVRTSKQPVGIYWYRGAQLNMGDEITPYLLAKLLGRDASEIQRVQKEPSRVKGLVLVSIGSVLRLCHNNTLIWGSGIRNIDQPVANAHRFCAVRGPLTRRRLIDLGYDCPEVYGDPALLLPEYYRPEVARGYALGIIPHLVDYDSVADMYADEKNVLIIDVRTDDIEHIVKQILSCECTVSSSLHGIVLSVAYGIPTRWLKCSDRIMGDDTKFYDFFASIEPSLASAFCHARVQIPAEHQRFEKYQPVLLHGSKMTIGQLIATTHEYASSLDLDALIKAFPGDYFSTLAKSA